MQFHLQSQQLIATFDYLMNNLFWQMYTVTVKKNHRILNQRQVFPNVSSFVSIPLSPNTTRCKSTETTQQAFQKYHNIQAKHKPWFQSLCYFFQNKDLLPSTVKI